MTHADPCGDRQTLRVLVRADRGIDQLVGHRIGELFPVIFGDELQHQVDGGRATCRRHPVAVDDEDRLCQLYFEEFFGKAVLVLPVDGRALAIEKARLGQRIASRAKPAHHGTPTCLPA